MTVYTGDDIHVWTDGGDQIEPVVRIGLSVLYAVNTIPMVLAFWLLSRVFSNVQNGRIFIEQNASFLLYYGLIQFFAAVFVPFIKLAVCGVVSRISTEPDGLDLSRFQIREVHVGYPDLGRQLIEPHFPVRQHPVKPNDNHSV